MIKLYSYFRSSSSYRVRIALNLKGLEHEIIPVHLLADGGEQFKPQFKSLNEASKIPVLIHNGQTLAQSISIIEYLDETFTDKNLYPTNAANKALVRQLCEIVNSDIQPLQNLAVLKKLVKEHGFTEEQKIEWIKHWITLGFQSYEALLAKTAEKFSFQNEVSAADCFLIPQVYNAVRFGVDMEAFPKIKQINDHCLTLEAFKAAHPDNQSDTPADT